MNRYVINLLKSSKGISIITIIIFAAVLVAALNAYAYFNPDFPLSQYTVNYFLGSYNDKVRKADMEKLRVAVEKYYDDFGEYPARDGFCGRIIAVLYPDAKNSIKTGLASSIVFLGLVFSYSGYHQGEAIAGIIIAIFIFAISYEAMKESSLILMDGCNCPGTRGNIKSLAESVEGVMDVHEISIRKSGPYVIGEMHIKVDGSRSVYEANEIVENIEKVIKDSIPALKRLTIKAEPLERTD